MMTSGPAWRERRTQVALGLAFLLGLLVGWWILGWWLAPVSYTNSLPQDLRADARGEYLQMVADQYAATNNSDQARQRIEAYGWPQDELTRDMAALQTRLNQQDPAEAQKVSQLAAAVVPNAPGPVAATPSGGATPVPGENPSLFARVCPAALYVLLFLGGIAALAWLWQRWRQSQTSAPGLPGARPPVSGWAGRRPGTAFGEDELRPAAPPVQRPLSAMDDTQPEWHTVPAPGTETFGSSYPSGGATYEEEDLTPEDEEPEPSVPATEFVEPDPVPPPPPPPTVVNPYPASVASAGAKPAGTAFPTVSADRQTRISEFTATYQAGEPDYDEAFDVKDLQGVVVGQCGLSLMMPVGRGNDQAAALQVWLWEERDQYTQVKVLVSEGAYRDTSLRSQLAEENPAIQVRPGLEFDMDSYNLRLHGIIEKVSYVEQEPFHQLFELLMVKMQVYQKDRS